MNFYSIIFIILALALIVLACMVMRLYSRLQKLLRGKSGASLEDSINEIQATLDTLLEARTLHASHLSDLNARTKKSIRNIEVKRFNPFADAGSNQSFSVALLNDEGNGVVLSSIYARERMSVYAKPIQNSKSNYELTEEETEVLSRAMK